MVLPSKCDSNTNHLEVWRLGWLFPCFRCGLQNSMLSFHATSLSYFFPETNGTNSRRANQASVSLRQAQHRWGLEGSEQHKSNFERHKKFGRFQKDQWKWIKCSVVVIYVFWSWRKKMFKCKKFFFWTKNQKTET